MNKELENKALEIIQKLQTYNPAAGDDPRWFKQCLLDLEDIIIDDDNELKKILKELIEEMSISIEWWYNSVV